MNAESMSDQGMSANRMTYNAVMAALGQGEGGGVETSYRLFDKMKKG